MNVSASYDPATMLAWDTVLNLIALLSLGGLLAVWVLYPLVIAALAAITSRRRTAAAPVEPNDRRVSVVIATRDDIETIRRRTIDCLEASYDAGKLEIVVAVDAGSAGVEANAFSEVKSELDSLSERVTVVAGDQPGGKAATLNAAVRAAHGDVLVFTDTHQRFHADAIRELVAALESPQIGAVSGALEIPGTDGRRSLAGRYWLFERWLRCREAVVHSSVGVTGAIWALRKSLWRPLPPRLILDDVYAPMQVVLQGHRVGFAPAARAIDTRHHNPAQEYQRKVRTLTGVIQVCTWLPRVLSPIHNPIWLQFMCHKLLRFLTPYFVVAVGVWAAVAVAQSLQGSLLVIAALTVVAVALLHYAKPNLIAIARETVVSGALIQTATIVGAVNGVRGRWDVWNNPSNPTRGEA